MIPRNPIQPLSADLAAKVAAGEVILRPVNVIKELVENSVDAGSTRILVEIEAGGKRLMRVTDNGSGIPKEELILALTRQATSKLARLEDFATLVSFGFRGEALHSMAAVSRLRLQSRFQGAESAHAVISEGGLSFEEEPSALREGTCIEVRELFFNLPARLKFLKGERYEKALIQEVLEDFALAHPNVSFTLVHNQEKIFCTEGGGEFHAALAGVFGDSVASRFLHFQRAVHPILKFEFEASLSRPENCRSDSRELRVFINRRIVRHPAVVRSVRLAYEAFQEKRRFPAGVVFLTIPPRMLDVNVHPQKLEVRIENEGLLEEFLLKTIRQGMTRSDPVPGWKTPAGSFTSQLKKWEEPPPPKPSVPAPPAYVQTPLREEPKKAPEPVREEKPVLPGLKLEVPVKTESEEVLTPIQRLQGFQLLGQLDKTFIVGQLGEEMLIVDQHIAQERILFEEFYRALKKGLKLQTQKLLSSVVLKLNARHLVLEDEAWERLQQMGFLVEHKNEELWIYGVPPQVTGKLDQEFLDRILMSLQGHGTGSQLEDYFRDLAASMACRGSIKAGDILSREVMQRLIEDLGLTANPFFCPHGRPVIVREPLPALYRRFNRTRK